MVEKQVSQLITKKWQVMHWIKKMEILSTVEWLMNIFL